VAAALFALVWTPSRTREHAERDARLPAGGLLGTEVLVPELVDS
jgi:hypothetical protein